MYFKIAWPVLKATELTAHSPTLKSQNVTQLQQYIWPQKFKGLFLTLLTLKVFQSGAKLLH